jgi:hypothetical protein
MYFLSTSQPDIYENIKGIILYELNNKLPPPILIPKDLITLIIMHVCEKIIIFP